MRIRPLANTRTCAHTYVYARACLSANTHVSQLGTCEKVAQMAKVGRETTTPATTCPGFVMKLKFCTCVCVCVGVHSSCRCCPRIVFLFVPLHIHVMCAVPTCMSAHARDCACAPASISRCYGRRMCQHRNLFWHHEVPVMYCVVVQPRAHVACVCG